MRTRLPLVYSIDEVEKLLGLIKENKFLYDLNDPDYTNRPKRHETWNIIANEMGTGNAKLWSAKWKSMRDNYSKYRRTYDPTACRNYEKYRNWPWASRMAFLDDCVVFTESRPVKFNQITTNIASEPDNTTPGDSIPENLKNKSEDNMEKTLDCLRIKSNKDHSCNEIDHFFLSYAQSFKKLPKQMQIMLKQDMATLFNRYESLQSAELLVQSAKLQSAELQSAEQDTIEQEDEESSDSVDSIKIECTEYSFV